jgi:hypothetical protein
VLVVAHPGHELRVHGWLEQARPRVLVLTDGAGRSGTSRLPATARVLARAGATPGEVFGRFRDRDIYEAMLGRDLELFRALAGDVAAALEDADYVVGDAAEGYNPTHDVCRLLVDAAAARVRRRRGRALASFAFPLVGPPTGSTPPGSTDVDTTLDADAFARKLVAARDYVELDGEVRAALDGVGIAAFRREVFQHVEGGSERAGGDVPFYERHGERRVAEGAYRHVLRRAEHVAPIAEALACES